MVFLNIFKPYNVDDVWLNDIYLKFPIPETRMIIYIDLHENTSKHRKTYVLVLKLLRSSWIAPHKAHKIPIAQSTIKVIAKVRIVNGNDFQTD